MYTAAEDMKSFYYFWFCSRKIAKSYVNQILSLW